MVIVEFRFMKLLKHLCGLKRFVDRRLGRPVLILYGYALFNIETYR